MNALTKLLGLSAMERRALLETALGVSWARLEVHLFPFQRVANSITASTPPLRAQGIRQKELELVRWATDVVAARLPWCRNCLAQAVGAKRVLNRRGISSTMHLGVASGGPAEAFQAHAWLEVDGQIVAGRTDGDFKVLFSHC
jgi:hypothetical protein